MTTRKKPKPAKKSARRATPTHRDGRRRSTAAKKRSRRTAPPRPAEFALATACTASQAAALKEGLMGLLEEALPVTLDAAGLERVDTVGLQLLAAFVRDRRAAGRSTIWRSQTPALMAAARVLGLGGMLDLADEGDR